MEWTTGNHFLSPEWRRKGYILLLKIDTAHSNWDEVDCFLHDGWIFLKGEKFPSIPSLRLRHTHLSITLYASSVPRVHRASTAAYVGARWAICPGPPVQWKYK